MKGIHKIGFLLLIIGGLNWLLVGLWGNDISSWMGGPGAILPRLIYILIGVAALIEIFSHKGICKACDSISKKM